MHIQGYVEPLFVAYARASCIYVSAYAWYVRTFMCVQRRGANIAYSNLATKRNNNLTFAARSRKITNQTKRGILYSCANLSFEHKF